MIDTKLFNIFMKDVGMEFRLSQKQASDYLALAARIECYLDEVTDLPKNDRAFWVIQAKSHRSTAAKLGKMVEMK